MRRRTLHLVGAVGLLAGAAAAAAPAATAATPHRQSPALPGIGRLIPSLTHELLPVHGGTVDSLNWSGYAVTPGSGITGVSSTFTVPSAGLLPPGFAATWAGIGGYNSTDLIQAGVGENSLITNPITGPQYYAWYELLPNAETPISGCTGDPSCTVNPGDSVTVNIQETSTGSGQWAITLTDAGHWSWTHTVAYASSGSSAEWILEAPTVGLQTLLADVGTVHFSSDTYNVSGGAAQSVGNGNPTTIDLSPGLINEATPSALSGSSFNDCAYAQSCAAP